AAIRPIIETEVRTDGSMYHNNRKNVVTPTSIPRYQFCSHIRTEFTDHLFTLSDFQTDTCRPTK
ncbi:hypothetical protein L9F63_012882, partial [Diploptera punctata]